MIHRINRKTSNNSTEIRDDRSMIVTENPYATWDTDREINFVMVNNYPKGDIISLIVHLGGEEGSMSIDGTPDIAGKTISFLPEDNIGGKQTEIKYLIES